MLNIAQIGAGKFGLNHLKILAKAPGAKVTMVCDVSESNLKKAGEAAPKAELTSSAKNVFENAGIDAVVVASTSETHYEMGLACLQKGKHCFIEKPMALRAIEAKRLVEEAEKRGKVLMVGHLLEYHPAVEKLKEVVDSGGLGKLLYLHAVRVNLGTVRSHENALWSLAPHDLSVMMHLLQKEPVAVSASGGCYLQKGIHDVVFFSLFFKGGTLATGHVSWLDPRKVRTFTVVGDQKMAVWNDSGTADPLTVYDKSVDAGAGLVTNDRGATVLKIGKQDPLSAELAAFIDCIQNKTSPRNDGRDGLRVVRVLEAAQHSLEQNGEPVEIK